MKTRALLTVFALSSLVGCAVQEEDFPTKAGTSACNRLEECNAEDYAEIYGEDDEACREDWADILELYLDAGDLLGETYDPAKGRDCVQEIRRADCTAIENGEVDCDVWADE